MITGIWENPYIQELGIIDHCHEIIVLKDGVRAFKAWKPEAAKEMCEQTQACLQREMMDLYLILEKWAELKGELKQARIQRFEEKGSYDI